MIVYCLRSALQRGVETPVRMLWHREEACGSVEILTARCQPTKACCTLEYQSTSQRLALCDLANGLSCQCEAIRNAADFSQGG